MSKVRRFSVCFVLALCSVMFLSGAVYAADYVYATTNMTWAEFYAGENVVNAASFDRIAVTNSADFGANYFPLLWIASDASGDYIAGFKSVTVRISEDVWNEVSGDLSADYTAIAFTDGSQYKALLSTDRTFGEWTNGKATINDTTITTATILDGASSTSADYTLTLTSNGPLNNVSSSDLMGAVVRLSDGSRYAMQLYKNLNDGDLFWNLTDKHTSDLEGKTIRGFEFLVSNSSNILTPNLADVKIKKWTDAYVKASGDVNPGTDVPVTLVYVDLPEGAGDYSLLGVYRNDPKEALATTAYVYSADVSYDVFTYKGDIKSGDKFGFIYGNNDNYVDIKGGFKVVAAETPVVGPGDDKKSDDKKSDDKPVTSGDVKSDDDSSGCDTGLGIFGLAALVGLIGYMKRK